MITWAYQVPHLRGAVVRAQSAAVAALYRRHFGPGLRVFGLPIIAVAPQSVLTVGHRATLISVSAFSEIGVAHACVLRTLDAGSRLSVGDDVGMSGCSIVASESVTIGDRVLLGADVIVADTDFHPVRPEGRRWSRRGVARAPITIEDNVFLGARSIVLKGVTIGADSVIAASSVVTRDIPPGVVAAGTPARVVGTI